MLWLRKDQCRAHLISNVNCLVWLRMSEPVSSLWTERSVNCECLPNLNCFVRGKLGKRTGQSEIWLFLFWHDSLLFSLQVQFFFLSLLISFFLPLPLCDPQCFPFPPLFFYMIFQQKKNTRGVNTYNFNRLKEEDTFHIWCCLPHPWWVDRGQGVLPIETFLLPFISVGRQKRNCNQQRWQQLSKAVGPKFGNFKALTLMHGEAAVTFL